jgi:hypothetical protein
VIKINRLYIYNRYIELKKLGLVNRLIAQRLGIRLNTMYKILEEVKKNNKEDNHERNSVPL